MEKGAQSDRYLKQILVREVGESGQKRLHESSVVVLGCGALGSVISNTIVRAGIGTVKIVDRDFIELDNLHRQVLFDEDDIEKGLPKAVAAAEKLRKVNSRIRIEPIVADVTPENIESIIRGSDLVFDGTDNFETRFLLNDASLKLNVPWVYGGVVSTCGMSYTIIPGETPCFRCLFDELPTPGSSPTCDTVGVLGTAVNVTASIETTEGMKLLTGRKDDLLRKLIVVDVWNGGWNLFKISKGPKPCPACDEKRFEFLGRKEETKIVSLCGQNAFQITPRGVGRISFNELSSRLKDSGDVKYNEWMFRFKKNPYTVTIFHDGRTIVKGTTDAALAKTLYAKLIGY